MGEKGGGVENDRNEGRRRAEKRTKMGGMKIYGGGDSKGGTKGDRRK